MSETRKPLSFGMTMLASTVGVLIVSVVGGLLMFVMSIAMMVSLSKIGKSDPVAVKPGTFLTVDLGKISGDRGASSLQLSFGEGKSIGLVSAMQAIRKASDDANVKGLLIKDDGAPAVSWASMEELRGAIAEFRQSGKPVVTYAASYSQPGYYLCTESDRLCLHPDGMIDFRGMGGQVMYYKDLLDKLGVEMQLIRPESCSYKSAGEVYTLNRMSDANREQIRAYIASIWRTAAANALSSSSATMA